MTHKDKKPQKPSPCSAKTDKEEKKPNDKRKSILYLASILIILSTIALLVNIVFQNKISDMQKSLSKIQYAQDKIFLNLQTSDQEHNRSLDTKKYVEIMEQLCAPEDKITIGRNFVLKQEKLAIYGAYYSAKGEYPDDKAQSEWMNLTDYDQLFSIHLKYSKDANDFSERKAGEYRDLEAKMISMQSWSLWLSIIIAIVNSIGLIIGFWASFYSDKEPQHC